MDVPFISSGATSRAHYALVRQVETAATPQAADQAILKEVDSIRQQFLDSSLSTKQCKELLILLLYCNSATSTCTVGDLGFAIPPALNLAAIGRTTQEKRIGYTFCAEIMPPDHELQLMLVNTLRKDLESSHVPHICLALEHLINSPTEDVIPAVQPRLHDLLSYNSPHIRRRALLAFRALSQDEPDILSRIESDIKKRLKDSDTSVINAALLTSTQFGTSGDIRLAVNNMLPSVWSSRDGVNRRILRNTLMAVRSLKPEERHARTIYQNLKTISKRPEPALLKEAFLMFTSFSNTTLTGLQSDGPEPLVRSISHLLVSDLPNDRYLFVLCLSQLDASLWAGTDPEIPAVLDELEVGRVMGLLDSPDSLIRKMVLRVLMGVDPGIVSTYYAQSVQTIPVGLSIPDKNQYVTRLLEAIDVQCGDDGELYANCIKDLFAATEGADHGSLHDVPVLESPLEQILGHVRTLPVAASVSCVTSLVVPLASDTGRVGPTFMVALAALICEFAGKISIAPPDILRGLATRLASYNAMVQETCLLVMLRVAAECDEISDEIREPVESLSEFSRKHIRNRCSQFLSLSKDRRVLADVVSRAASSSLLDFAIALSAVKAEGKKADNDNSNTNHSHPPPQTSPASSITRSPNKLRYDAYAAPQVSQSRHFMGLRHRALTSDSASNTSRSRERSPSLYESHELEDLSRTVSPGDLTLAAATGTLSPPRKGETTAKTPVTTEDLSARIDLISLDSPFVHMADPGAGTSNPPSEGPEQTEFEQAWEAMEENSARGWCEASQDVIVRQLQNQRFRLAIISVDQPPYEGELKVLIQPPSAVDARGHAALRLREGDDDTCLWRLRCEDTGLRMAVKKAMEEM